LQLPQANSCKKSLNFSGAYSSADQASQVCFILQARLLLQCAAVKAPIPGKSHETDALMPKDVGHATDPIRAELRYGVTE
jgi:hypothetical protein